MIALDFEQNPAYPQWAADLLDINRGYFGHCSTIALLDEKEIRTVLVYSSFNGINCEVTVASTGKWWLRKDVLKVLMKYPFDQLGCQRITLLVKENNKTVLRLVEHMGFVREGCLRQYHDDGINCIILGMLKSERRH